jgi:hypothetical protein
MQLNVDADHTADKPYTDIENSEFKQLILKRKLQAIIVSGTLVLLLIVLMLMRISMASFYCGDGCSPYVVNNEEIYEYDEQWYSMDDVIEVIQAGLIGAAVLMWGYFGFRLYLDVRRWLVKLDEQRQIDAAAALHLRTLNALVNLQLDSDGELSAEVAVSNAPADSPLQSLVSSPAARALISTALRWFFVDVFFVLHVTAFVGWTVFILGWWLALWVFAGLADGEVLFFNILPIMFLLGFFLLPHWQNWLWNRENRDVTLHLKMETLDLAVQERLSQAGLSMDEIDMDTLVGKNDINSEDTEKPKPGWNSLPVTMYLLPEIETPKLKG